MGLCRLKMLEGEFVAARDLYRENIERSHDSSFPRQLAAQVEFFARDFSAAEKLYAGLAAENADGGGSFYGCVSFSSALGFLQRLAGNESGGRALLTESLTKEEKALQRSPGHPEILYRVAALESCLGHTEASLQHLAAAARAGWLDYRSLNFDPRFDAIRTSVQYQKITQEMVARVALLRRSQTMGHG